MERLHGGAVEWLDFDYCGRRRHRMGWRRGSLERQWGAEKESGR